ncbi:hypothetical protein DACRYDRAFT_84227 [Dacryopinax primogenitus]|uniref:Pescadillo homolog n=1 Tax=Dacryopinax primogenitus (strain DJM 731) TaxID=1858805 RepID=M5FWR7_DACPD|nr:uncharacterized protein DACRYDRAFT_84227 [Dacryopinax primogenitus]EJT97886.1 hypothetical protein DACRYDRAFT_84227 [Dacryopinax primogenitus]
MGKIQRKGKTGASKTYITRTHAVRKLQLSLGDFRRLCILKGLYPVEPPSRKKANKGSTAPTTFYYTKDIAYLAHEPVLSKLRQHKAFAKKLARAIGRSEWADAKSLEQREPKYKLDHIIKERYPTFIDAVRDIDDALCLVHLFSTLPSNDKLDPKLIAHCARLSAEWQLYVMRAHALRKVFLSIKGVYFQAEVMGQPVTWLVPYMFTQQVPADVDFRVMLTFLELYQTLLGFVLFKLYSTLNLVYPPPLDEAKDELAAGVGAYVLKEAGELDLGKEQVAEGVEKVREGDVRRALEGIPIPTEAEEIEEVPPQTEGEAKDEPDEPKELPSKLAPAEDSAPEPAPTPERVNTSLFSPFVIYISREVTRPVFEFVLRSFGARVGWAPSLGSGSPYSLEDPRITHVLLDRPQVPLGWVREGRRYVQPQWVVDCVNSGRVVPEGAYAMGEVLPPHLSPFVQEVPGGVVDAEGGEEEMDDDDEEEAAEDIEDAEADEEEPEEASPTAKPKSTKPKLADLPALLASASDPSDPSLLRAAELEAESLSLSHAEFQALLKQAIKRANASPRAQLKKQDAEAEEERGKMLMSRKKRQLYEKMKFGNERKREGERKLQRKREALRREGK